MQGKDFINCNDFANTIDRFIEILNRGDMKTQTHRQVEQVGPRLAQNVLKIMNVKIQEEKKGLVKAVMFVPYTAGSKLK